MRFKTFFKIMISTLISCLLISGTVSGGTVEAGDAISSWLGKREIHENGNERVLFHGVIDGVIFIQMCERTVRAPMHTAKMHCPVAMNVDKNTKERASNGFCVIMPHDDSDMIYKEFQCASYSEECQGEWTHNGGTGKHAGISGTTKYRSREDIGVQRKKGRSAAMRFGRT